jgi:hypothetical protein
MEIDVPLKPPGFKRDEMGRFDRRGKTLAKTQKKTGLIKSEPKINSSEPDGRAGNGGFRAGSGRKPGSKNKVTLQLKEAVLKALDNVGGHLYLEKLALENSSAFAALLGRILPHTIAPASESDGGGRIEFTRVIVMPDGHRHIEGKTPLRLASPASHTLPNSCQLVAKSEPDVE